MLANINNVPTYENTKDAITALERMIHRGAIAADGKSGDGSGLLFSLPTAFMKNEAKRLKVDLPEQFAVAMVFFTNDKQKEIFENICEQNDLKTLLYRKVPINKEALGELALKTLPEITQVFVVANSIISTKRFEALLYLTRKMIEKALQEDKSFYIPSFSNKVISYKGLIMPTYLREFYIDLQDRSFKTVFALFHQRFSTNTLPEWRLTQPFRCIAHNGEINSISANRFNIKAKSEYLRSAVFSENEIKNLLPITNDDISDSASLDNVFEFLISNGYDFFKAARVLIPAPWQNAPHIDSKLRAFYEYASNNFEPWDGPAAVSLTNGRYIACILDRNGLRPAKYIITKDNRILIASEYGVLDIDEENIGGAIVEMLRRAGEKLKAHNRAAMDVTSGATHEISSPYPLSAVQQILYNAVLHRTYERTNAPVRVYWFNDRIEIHSPGGPYGNVTPENFGQPGITDYRNPNIAAVMKVFGFVQAFGRGISIAKNELERNGNPPLEFFVNQSAVLCTIWRKL